MLEGDWKYTVREGWDPVSVRLFIHRSTGDDRTLLITGWTETGTPEVTTLAGYETSDFQGFVIPYEVGKLLLAAQQPVKDRKGELDAVNEALQVERARVQLIIERLLPTGVLDVRGLDSPQAPEGD
jgi:hypothetical protein